MTCLHAIFHKQNTWNQIGTYLALQVVPWYILVRPLLRYRLVAPHNGQKPVC